MTKSTFSVQVANKYLTILQGYSKTIRLLLVMLLTLTISAEVWAEEETLACPAGTISNNEMTWNLSSCTIVHAKGSNSSYASYSPWRVYQGAIVTFTPKSNTSISEIVITATSSAYATAGAKTWTNATASASSSTITVTPTDGTKEISVTAYAQTRWSKIAITYTTAGGGGSTPTQLDAPTGLTVGNITSSGATLSWNAVANASSYIVTMVDGASLEKDYPVNGTTKTFDSLNPSTDYLWTVTAVGDGINYTNSEESETGEFTTSASAGGGGGEGECSWKETAIGNIEDDDIVVITMTTSNGTTYAMSNDNGTGSAPAATTVTVSSSTLTGNIADNLKWNISNSNGTLTIYPNETTSTWLYCTSTNNGVRVGTNENKTFTIDATSGYLKHVGTSRFLGVYTTTPDWRCYTNTTGNTANQTLKFYVYQCSDDGGDDPEPEPDPVDPEVTFSDGEYTVGGAALDLSTLLTTNSTGAVTYSVETDGGTGATIEGSTFTATAAGTCRVQASIANTTYYNAAIATANIIVTVPATVEGTWTLVTDAASLKAGDRIVIAAAESDFALSTTQNTNNRGQAAVTKNGNNITFTEATQIITLEAGTVDNTLAFNTGAGYLYAASSSSNHLKTQTTNNNNGSWSISIDGSTGVATVVAQGTNTRNMMQYNATDKLFACYSSATQKAIAIYKEGGGTTTYTITSTLSHVTANGENPTTITSEAEDLTLLYSAESGWNLPATISVTMGGNQLMLNDEYTWDKETGKVWIVPANGFTGDIVVTINGWQQLAAPTGLNVSNITSSGATLAWNAVTHATSYTVQVYGETDEIIAEYTDLTQTTKEVSGLESDTYYIWAVTAIGDGTTYTDSEESETAEFTTSAVAPNTYTITFEANGGTRIDKITDATALPDPLPTTTRDHYTFAGWFTDEDCTQAATAGATINANTTLYAKWTPVTYTVTFDAGSGTYTSGDIQGNFETGITLPTATPCSYASTNGWSFVGWSESSVSETTVRPAIHTGNYKPTKNITLHAVYAKTGTAQGGAGEFILSMQYEGTPYYVGQTFDNNKLSAETSQANAALFTIEDNYLHYEGGYISHVATTSSPNITKQADKENAKAWTIAENGNTITFTSTADNTRGLGFNYNNGSPRFAAYQLSNADYPHTFTKTSVSGGNVQVTTYNSNPSCEAPIPPTWQPVTINHSSIQVECGSKTLLNAVDPNGPATITFNGSNLVNPVTVTASEGFLVSINKTDDAAYSNTVTVNPVASGENQGKITQNVYVIAQAPAQSGNYDGTITLTGADITNGSQVINVTAAVTCTQYTITWSVSGDTEMIEPTTFYAGGEWTLPEDPTFDCNGRVFVGWTDNEIVQPQDIAPNVLYKEQGDFPTIESDITFYAVFAQEGTGDGSGTATVTDILNRETTGATSTTYIAWSDKKATSSAVYAGNSAGGNESIQLRSDANKDAAGIITTTSGGKATNITVVWHNQTLAGRTLNVYGKKSAYSAVADLRNEDTRGTLLGTIVNGTSTSLTINDDYEYIGLCSKSGAMYLTSISITWETDGEGGYTDYSTSCGTYTVTFYGFNRGGCTTTCGENPAEIEVAQGATYTIPNCVPNDPAGLGRIFAGTWNTQADGQGSQYKPGDGFTVDSDITLYAQWILKTTEDIVLPTDVEDLATTDIVVTGGTTLTLEEGTTTINSLTLKGGLQENDDYLMPAIYSDGEASVELNNKTIPFDLSVDKAHYYPFAVPFPVAVSDVDYADPTLASASVYGTHYVIKRYDGAMRADKGENKNANWVKVAENETLQPGIGYIITAVPIDGEALIRFPMSPEQLWLSEDKTVDVEAHTGAAAQQHSRHAGWNFIANPYLSRFAGVNVGNENNLLNGVLNYVNGEWQTTGEVPYVTIPAPDFSYYEQVELDNAILSPSYAFFVQAAHTAALSFATTGRQQNMPALRAASKGPLRMPLTISQSTQSDRTTLLVSDDYTTVYEIGKDLEKMFGSAEYLTLYSLMANQTPLAFCATPWSSAVQSIPLGYRTNKSGSVTIALDASADMSDAEMVLLYDAVTGMTTNLLLTDYVFETETGTFDARFTLTITPKQGATTGCEEVMLPTDGTYKFLRNGQLYINHRGTVYTVEGKENSSVR